MASYFLINNDFKLKMLNHAMQELLFWAPMEVLLCHWPVKLDVLSRRVSPFYINWLFPSHPGMKGSVFSLQVNYTIFKWHHTAKQGIWIRGRNGSCDDMSSACAPCTLASTCKISSRQVWPNNYYRLLPNVEPSTGTSEGTPSHESPGKSWARHERRWDSRPRFTWLCVLQ